MHAALAVLLGLNGLLDSEACGADIENLGFERGHRTLQIVGKGSRPAGIPLVRRTARAGLERIYPHMLAAARTALQAGHDVIVPQFLARPEFVILLEDLARDIGATFVEIALTATAEDVRAWFDSRSAEADTATHVDAQLLVDRLGGPAVLDQMHDAFAQLVDSRPGTQTIPARVGDVDHTLQELERLLAEDASEYREQ